MGASTDAVIADWLARRVAPAAAWARRHPRRLDAVCALGLVLVSLAGVALQGHRLRRADVLVFCVLLPAPLVLRFGHRRLAAALVALVALAQWITSTPQLADAAVLIALFWVALDGEPTEIGVAAVVAEAGAVMAALRWSPHAPLKVWAGVSGLCVAAAGLGVAIRLRRALLASLRERAARLELERDREGELAAAAERARIAREMHDIVSHNLTVMIGLADGAAYAHDSAPERSLEATRRIAATGREALGEMRRLLGVLREATESPYTPQPGLDGLEALLARVEAAGIPVTIEVSGAIDELPEGVQLTVFRVAQEALTNTLRHAGRPAAAFVTLAREGARVRLVVWDTGRTPPAPGTGGTVPGRGLAGMRERAAAYGGVLSAGPGPAGGWRVELELVLDPAPAVLR